MSDNDPERDRFSQRLARVAQVGAQATGAVAAIGAHRLLRREDSEAQIARALRDALGNTRGPLMKVAQMLATIPDLLPPDLARELQTLQANAPSMGWSFVKRRMRAELGADWEGKFAHFEREAVAAASLGQVHRARDASGRDLAVKLQYPEMASAVEADLAQLRVLIGLFQRLDKAIDPSEIAVEIGARLREELDYGRERRAMQLYAQMLAPRRDIAVPEPVAALSTDRLLTMTWLEGQSILAFKDRELEARNRIADQMFHAWWLPMTAYGVIHGDPHLGNYAAAGDAEALNLLDFGCIRIFPPQFVAGVIGLYRALYANDLDGESAAYDIWGFRNLSRPLIEALNLWARFIYGPLLDDRVRSVADGVSPGEYGRREAFRVRQMLKDLGPVRIPREFVFMDRAAIGLGAAFLHLGAQLNFHALFEASIAGFDEAALARRQADGLAQAGLA